MAKTTLSVLFMVTILLSAVATSSMMESADALKSKGTKLKQYGKSTSGKICGDMLCDNKKSTQTEETMTAPMEEPDAAPMEEPDAAPMEEPDAAPMEEPEEAPMEEPEEAPMEESETMMGSEKMDSAKIHQWTVVTKTIQSVQDPGIGHESHQLAVILPPSDMIYKGTFAYAASEPIQLVALHGPLAEGEDSGQPIWSPDGETKFALTFVDPEQASGTWNFAGNALAVHTKNTEPFTVSYTVSYMEKIESDTVKSGTTISVQDPGVGHESHQLAVILPPSNIPYTGMITYAASEPIQLVALHGPLAEGEDSGQPIWSPDGETKFALTFVDPEQASGTWNFAGNALAVHTKNTEPFTVSYTIVASQ